MPPDSRYTGANRIAWNEAAPYHKKNRPDDLHALFNREGYSTLDSVITPVLTELGLAGKRVAQLCCNNGRELISMVNLGARQGVGFDISDAFIAEANELRDIAGADCRFVRTDVLTIDPAEWGLFDLVYISIGALCWLPCMDSLFRIVAAMLAPGGHLVIYESHPFIYMLALPGEDEFQPEHPRELVNSYFQSEPLTYCDGLDYYGGEDYEGGVKYEFVHTLSDIVTPIARHGLVIRSLREYSHDISNLMAHLEGRPELPLSFILTASRP